MARTFLVKWRGAPLPSTKGTTSLGAKHHKLGHGLGHGCPHAECMSTIKDQEPWNSSQRRSEIARLLTAIDYAVICGGAWPTSEDQEQMIMTTPNGAVTLTTTTTTVTTTTTTTTTRMTMRTRSRTSAEAPGTSTAPARSASTGGRRVYSGKPKRTMYMRLRTRSIRYKSARLTSDVDEETVSFKDLRTVTRSASIKIQTGRVLRPRRLARNYKV
ncbi:hypothetical protein M413DRAFT_27542 [Hebeloma cylindrosporum]|uniref:Uncharacterized protein n=1 Tax=Hebeloma cylindrosporum TaxID=76867 RepID=A0A0C3CCP5_HEBCY|nr:hypothetical protein M413DRAFT_27542 [Hebeloma cylindrosporum h7]